jgi:hypothetical protein
MATRQAPTAPVLRAGTTVAEGCVSDVVAVGSALNLEPHWLQDCTLVTAASA